MNRRAVASLAISVIFCTLMACGSPGQTGPSVSQRATGLAQTAAALLTSTAAASVTPVTPTVPPTATIMPTATISPVPVTDTPSPTATATPCPNLKADFVADVNVPDGTHFAPGSDFKKTWRLRNSGDCAWTTDYTLRYVGGEPMSGVTISLPNAVPPGATIDLTISLVAPTSPGKHIGRWQLFTPDGSAFGTKPYVQIMVS